VKTLAAVQYSAVAVAAGGSAVVEKASGSAVVSNFAVAEFVANLQQPLLVEFVVVVNSDAVPLVVPVVVLQLLHFAGLRPVTSSVHGAAVAVKLVLQLFPVAAAAAPAVDQHLAACSVKVTVALFAAAGLDGVAMLQTHAVEVVALVQIVAPAAGSVLEKQLGNYLTQLHSDLLQDLP
jgi:hypothetical protein